MLGALIGLPPLQPHGNLIDIILTATNPDIV